MLIRDHRLMAPHLFRWDCLIKRDGTGYDCGVTCHTSEYIRRDDGFYDTIQCDNEDPDAPIHTP